MDINEVKAKMGHRVTLMGNVPPLDVGVCGTLASFGSGISPATPPENIDALLNAVREWSRIENEPDRNWR